MGEFAETNRAKAAAALRKLAKQDALGDPIVELLSFLLEDGARGVVSTMPVTMDQWLTWNDLLMNREEELVQTMMDFLEEEGTNLPEEITAMQEWAANLLLNTLDQMGML